MSQKNGMVNTLTIKGPTIGINPSKTTKPLNTFVIYPSINVIIVKYNQNKQKCVVL